MTDVGLAAGELAEAHAVFQQPWWLDAVAPGAWHDLVVTDANGIAARQPVVIRRRHGLVSCTMPPLTKPLGPWVRPSEAKFAEAQAQERDLLAALVTQLPKADVFRQTFAPEATNWHPYFAAGCTATVRYTFRFNDLSDVDAIWGGARENVRRNIRKAQKQLTVRDDLGFDALWDMIALTYGRQDRPVPFPRALLAAARDAAVARARCLTLVAEAADGVRHAAAFFVHDANVGYYLTGGADPDLRNSGAQSLLLWEGIRRLAGHCRVFDFEGSMVPPLERFFSSFGARRTPMLEVTRLSRRMRVLQAGRELLTAITGR